VRARKSATSYRNGVERRLRSAAMGRRSLQVAMVLLTVVAADFIVGIAVAVLRGASHSPLFWVAAGLLLIAAAGMLRQALRLGRPLRGEFR
jgi:hypothetical protein